MLQRAIMYFYREETDFKKSLRGKIPEALITSHLSVQPLKTRTSCPGGLGPVCSAGTEGTPPSLCRSPEREGCPRSPAQHTPAAGRMGHARELCCAAAVKPIKASNAKISKQEISRGTEKVKGIEYLKV